MIRSPAEIVDTLRRWRNLLVDSHSGDKVKALQAYEALARELDVAYTDAIMSRTRADIAEVRS